MLGKTWMALGWQWIQHTISEVPPWKERTTPLNVIQMKTSVMRRALSAMWRNGTQAVD